MFQLKVENLAWPEIYDGSCYAVAGVKVVVLKNAQLLDITC